MEESKFHVSSWGLRIELGDIDTDEGEVIIHLGKLERIYHRAKALKRVSTLTTTVRPSTTDEKD